MLFFLIQLYVQEVFCESVPPQLPKTKSALAWLSQGKMLPQLPLESWSDWGRHWSHPPHTHLAECFLIKGLCEESPQKFQLALV